MKTIENSRPRGIVKLISIFLSLLVLIALFGFQNCSVVTYG